jgi:NAD(P)H-quinone oxidoreductase subunit 5
MEAPTPISALLHAGIVNLGGFVLLRFAPVVDRANETRIVLVVLGTITAVVAAIVMTTRISVKVSLAWSTCAQMGFMLMQCGLGLWEMALLHLIAHSLYKAHAFLGAGEVVLRTQRRQLLPKSAAPNLTSIAPALLAAVAGTVVAGFLATWLSVVDRPTPALWVLGGIVAAALVPLLTVPENGSISPTSVRHDVRLKAFVSASTVAFAYFCLHGLFAQIVGHGTAPSLLLVLGVALAFASLFTMQIACTVFPMKTWIRRLYPWFYGGLFVDEAFTRFAFRLWPPPRSSPSRSLLPDQSALPPVSFRSAVVANSVPTPSTGKSENPKPLATITSTVLDGSVA